MNEDICKEIRLVNNILKAEDFIRLRIETGFAEIPVEHARKALQNGLINVSALYRGELVGMGRLVGDGAMYWYLQETASKRCWKFSRIEKSGGPDGVGFCDKSSF